MFTWDCPKCGHELDVDAEKCPKCGTSFKEELASAAPASSPPLSPPAAPVQPAPPQATPPAPAQAVPTSAANVARPPFAAPLQAPTQPAPPAQAYMPSAVPPQTRAVPPVRPESRQPFTPPAAQPLSPPAPAQPLAAQRPLSRPPLAQPSQPAVAQPPLPEPAPPAQARSPRPSPYGVQPKHLALVLIVLVTAVVTALFFSRPSLFSGDGLALEDVPEEAAGAMGAGSAVFGDLQVAGVRTWYTPDHKPKVRAVIINHGEVPRAGVDLQVHLRPAAAPADSPPLASFSIRLDEALEPQQIRDVEADLMAMGTLASFPKWDKLRVDLEAR